MSPQITAKQQIAIKQEAQAGTAETLLAVNVIVHRGDAEWDSDVPPTEREALSASFSSRGSVIGTKAAKIRFSMYCRGTVGTPVQDTNEPDFSVPLRGCGVFPTVSGTTPNQQTSFKPDTSKANDETTGPYCTVGLYKDGKLYKIHGAVGDATLTFETGRPVLAEFDFTGVYNTPVNAAMLAPTYPAIVEPPFLSAALSILGFATAKIKTLKVNVGNKIGMRSYPNGASGFLSAQITGRKTTGSFDPEETLTAEKDWFNEFIAGTTGAITTGVFPSTGTNYNQFQLTIAKAAYIKVGLGDRDGIAIAPVDFECQATVSAGDDDFEFIQT
jgi:hypothetical protein